MYFTIFAISLFLTLLIEMSLSLLFGVRRKGILIVVLVNMLTNPVAVCLCLLIRIAMPAQYYLPIQIIIEILVVIVEGHIYHSFQGDQSVGHHPWLMALILNIISYNIGLLINYLL